MNSRPDPAYSVRDISLIALLAAGGMVFKAAVGPAALAFCRQVNLPGGVVMGGVYMMWVVLGRAFTHKPFSATLVGAVQAGLGWVMGTIGPTGPTMLLSFVLPGLAADATVRAAGGGSRAGAGAGAFTLPVALAAGAAANAIGVGMRSYFFLHLPLPAWLGSVAIGAISGATGGAMAWVVQRKVRAALPGTL
ncbi:MAG: hypothetical protein BWY85_01336 [Firmicutes bacterium ADurb.Bin506]|nr:MAG: hypothetical protein BWY85_01336 [Firmicutes bacterium ADurb.Bin506]